MNVELELIKFRFKQLFRTIKSVGWANLLIAVPILFLFLLAAVEKLQNIYSPYAVFLYGFLVSIVHPQRKDHAFLRKIEASRLKLYSLEYSLLCLPLSLVLGVSGCWRLAGMGHLSVILLSGILPSYSLAFSSSSGNWRIASLPDVFFEWKASARRYNYALWVLWILGVLTALNSYAYFMFAFALLSIISETFKPSEGKELRPAGGKQILMKLGYNTWLLIIVLTPHIAIYLSINSAYWNIMIGIILYIVLYQVYCILYKYGTYSQYRDAPNQISTLVFIAICPVLIVSIPMVMHAFNKAKNRMRYA